MNSVNKGIEIVYKAYDTKLFKLKEKELARAPSLCVAGAIGEEFFKASLAGADAYVIAYDVYKNGIRGSIRGFACLKFDTFPDYVYLDLICRGGSTPMNYRGKPSAAPGRAILDNVKKIARATKRKGVVLSAIEKVIDYYKKFGFRITTDLTCNRRTTLNRNRRRWTFTKDFYKEANLRAIESYNKKLKAEEHGTLMLWCA